MRKLLCIQRPEGVDLYWEGTAGEQPPAVKVVTLLDAGPAGEALAEEYLLLSLGGFWQSVWSGAALARLCQVSVKPSERVWNRYEWRVVKWMRKTIDQRQRNNSGSSASCCTGHTMES